MFFMRIPTVNVLLGCILLQFAKCRQGRHYWVVFYRVIDYTGLSILVEKRGGGAMSAFEQFNTVDNQQALIEGLTKAVQEHVRQK